MKEMIDWMVKNYGLSPRDAMSLWNMMIAEGKQKGVDFNKMKPQDLMNFIQKFMAVTKGAK